MSLHDGAAHWLLLQTWLTQSLPETHDLPVAHFGHEAPPQSTSVSVPSFMASVQDTTAVHTPLWHRFEEQSELTPHCLPLAHLPQTGPPQSMSVSCPSFAASLHEPATQTLPAHRPVWQSEDTVQALPVAHLGQAGPPQSTSVSPPFFIMSEHESTGVHTLFTHSVLAQSVPKEHALPLAQCAHEGP